MYAVHFEKILILELFVNDRVNCRGSVAQIRLEDEYAQWTAKDDNKAAMANYQILFQDCLFIYS
jgi:hypothetical protein